MKESPEDDFDNRHPELEAQQPRRWWRPDDADALFPPRSPAGYPVRSDAQCGQFKPLGGFGEMAAAAPGMGAGSATRN